MKLECKRCKRKLKILVKGVCGYCDPELHSRYFKNLYDVKEDK